MLNNGERKVLRSRSFVNHFSILEGGTHFGPEARSVLGRTSDSRTRVSPKNHSRVYNIICFLCIPHLYISLLVLRSRHGRRFVSYFCPFSANPTTKRFIIIAFDFHLHFLFLSLSNFLVDMIRNENRENSENAWFSSRFLILRRDNDNAIIKIKADR